MQPAQMSIALQQGIAAAKAGNNIAARDMLRRAAEVQPSSEQAWFWLAYLADNPDDRHSNLRQILRMNPLHAQARSVLKKSLLQAGIDAGKAGDRDRARTYFDEAIDLDPDCEQSWLWLASVSTSYKEVMDCLGRVLEINPHNERARSWLSRPASQREAFAGRNCPLCGFSSAVKAERCFKCKAILTLTDLDMVIENRDVDHELVHKAIDRYESIAATAENPSILFTLGLAYLNVNRIPEAVWYLQRVAEQQPDNDSLRRKVETLECKLRSGGLAKVPNTNPLVEKHPPAIVQHEPVWVAERISQHLAELDGRETTEVLQETSPAGKDSPHTCKEQHVYAEAEEAVTGYGEAGPIFTEVQVDEPDYAPTPQPEVCVSESPALAEERQAGEDDYHAGSLDAVQVDTEDAEVAAEPDLERIEIVEEEQTNGHDAVPVLEMVSPEPSPPKQHAIPRLSQGIVLVVDDSPTVRKIVAVTLEREGYRVLSAAGAMEALARINEAMPDLMLLDISMPHMDGYQLCKLIKANTLTKSVPVVMLSGKDGFFDKVRGKMSGATYYITKPFEPGTLINAVHRFCRRPVAA